RFDVRLAPKAPELLHRRATTQCAKNGHWNRPCSINRACQSCSDLSAQQMCCLNHDFQLLGRKLPADCHEAAVGSEPDLLRRQILKHPCNAALHGVYGWSRAIARVDAAEHHDPIATGLETLGAELTAAEFHGEPANSCLHQFRQHPAVFVFMLGRSTEARIAVAEMTERRDRYPVQAAVERLGSIAAHLVMVARHCRFVDLDHVAAGSLYFQQLLIQSNGNVECQLR